MTRGHAEQAVCGGCGAPLAAGERSATLCRETCIDGYDVDTRKTGMRDLLSKLTARVIGGEAPGRTPLRSVMQRHPGSSPPPPPPGYGQSTAWDAPRGEASNIPRMLRESRGRQTRFRAEQGRRTTGGEVPQLAVDRKADDRLVELERVIAHLTLATMKITGTMPTRGTWGAIARWLDGQLDVVRRQDWAPDALAALRRAVLAAERHVDRPPTRLYLGPCDRRTLAPVTGIDLGPCPGEYLGRDGDALASCTACRATVAVEARKRALLAEASDRWLTARQVEELTVALGFPRVPDSTVESWGARGQVGRMKIPLDREDGDAVDVWHYLLRDVLARLEAAQNRTRTSRTA